MYKFVNFSSLVMNLVSQCTVLGANTIVCKPCRYMIPTETHRSLQTDPISVFY